MRTLTSLLLLTFALGCKSENPCKSSSSAECADDEADTGEEASGLDADEDGFQTPDDCDDKDPSVHPEAKEYCDGIDNDCDGKTDERDAVNAHTYFVDADGDGFGDPDSTIDSCELSGGMSEDDSDCDDSAASAYPGAEEVWYDGIDNDCLGGSDDDADGDGHPGGPEGTDCDDTEPATNPDTEERCGDGIDNNCDGDLGDCGRTGELSADDAEGRLYGNVHDSWAGSSVALAADLTGDGRPDILIGAPRDDLTASNSGTAYVVPGPIAGVSMLGESGYQITGFGAGDQAGSLVLAPGDLDGDGLGDILVSAPGAGATPAAGAVYLVPGPVSGDLSLADSPGWIVGDEEDQRIGTAVAAIGDQDGDGIPEVLIGVDSDGEAGVAWLLSGPISMEREISEGYQIAGLSAGAELGASVAAIGDLNSDGVEDLAIGAPGTWISTPSGEVLEGAGAIHIFLGPVLRDLDTSEADATLRGIGGGDRAGQAIVGIGDVDGDGSPDIAIGAPGAEAGMGKVFIVAGPVTSSAPLASAVAQIAGTIGAGQTGEVLSAGGDADADGLQDLLIGAPRASASAGRAHLFYGPLAGTLTDLDADITVSGAEAGHRLGAGLAGGEDLDIDGTQDLLIGSPGEDTSGDGAGAALIFFGSGS